MTSYSGNTLIDDRTDYGVQNSVVLDDILITGFGADTVYAGSGNDVIVTDLPGSIYYSADHLVGMKGDDILFGGQGRIHASAAQGTETTPLARLICMT